MPDSLFSAANLLAMAGWIVLALSPLSPRWSDRISGLAIPLVLSVGYTALVLAFWSRAPGGFDSLPNVMALFTMPEIALAGWVHYLAFDLFIGTFIAVEADKRGWNRVLQAPLLVATFMFGPLGLLLFYLTRATEAALTFRKV